MVKLNYSQKIYPKKLVIYSDTVICLTSKQIKKVNLMYNYNEELFQENKKLNLTLEQLSINNHKKDSLFRINRILNDSLMLEYKTLLQKNNNLYYKSKRNNKIMFVGGLLSGILLTLIII